MNYESMCRIEMGLCSVYGHLQYTEYSDSLVYILGQETKECQESDLCSVYYSGFFCLFVLLVCLFSLLHIHAV